MIGAQRSFGSVTSKYQFLEVLRVLFSDYAWACVGGVSTGSVAAIELSLCDKYSADSDDCNALPQADVVPTRSWSPIDGAASRLSLD
jgi:hypothetical protein